MKKNALLFLTMFYIVNLYSQGNVGIGTTTPSAKLHVNGNVKVEGANTLEMGGGIIKEVNAGKIGYSVFTPQTLDIVGAGTSVGGRKIKLWAEGGLNLVGSMEMQQPRITSSITGVGNNLLPVAYGHFTSTGLKQGGTPNLSCVFVTDHYELDFGNPVRDAIPLVTVLNSNSGAFATYILGDPTKIFVYIWNTSGNKTQRAFSVVIYRP